MAKGTRGRRRKIASRQHKPTPYDRNTSKLNKNQQSRSSEEKKDYEDANCSVCMEYPHNAVLLLCSSHDKGCRPYMCGTSCRYSNCLDQYKKAYTKIHNWVDPIDPVTELACPLCRGQVKGWTVVEPAREYLNEKKRTCMHDKCLFVGAYKEMRKHVKNEHPSEKPRQVDPVEEQKWRSFERERERDDVISTIRSSMPGAVVFGDYVIEGGRYGGVESDDDDDDVDATGRDPRFEMGGESSLNVFLFLNSAGAAGNVGSSYRPMTWHDSSEDSEDESGGGGGEGMSLASRLSRQGRVLLGRSGRRRGGGGGRR